MSVDLSAAVEAAYRANLRARKGADLAPGEYEATASRVEIEWMTAAVTAAAPPIEAAVREQVARDLEAVAGASRDEAARQTGLEGAVFRTNARVLETAARIARTGA